MKYLERLVLALLLLTWCGCGDPAAPVLRTTDALPSTEPRNLSCSLVNERLVCQWR